MGYFLQSARRDYIIFDKNSTIGYYPVATKYLPIIHSLYVGSFFTHYPRHRTLISINKRHTGTSGPATVVLLAAAAAATAALL